MFWRHGTKNWTTLDCFYFETAVIVLLLWTFSQHPQVLSLAQSNCLSFYPPVPVKTAKVMPALRH